MKAKAISKNGTEQIIEVKPGQTVKMSAQPGARYQFVDAQGKPLAKLKAKHNGADLELTDEATGESVTLEGYYDQCAAGACTLESADGGQLYVGEGDGTPATVDALAPGQEASYALASMGVSMGGIAAAVGGLALAGAAAGGGGAAAAVAQVASYVISGGIAAGPVVTGHGLTVTAWDKNGNKLGESAVGADGKYSITIGTGYKGAVLLKVTDADTGTDYFDEATGAAKDLTVDLRAAGSATGGNLTINLNPLTELAVRKLGIITDAATASEADIAATNVKVGELFGLGAGKNITSETPVTVVKADGTADTTANAYGKVLALISGLEKNSGTGTDAVLTDMADSLTGSGSTLAFDPADADDIKTQLMAAAVTVEGAITGVTVSDQIAAMDQVIAGATAAPLAWTSDTTAFSVAENGTAAFTSPAAVTTSGATVTYTLGGTDAALFAVSATGVVTFASAPNYEAPADGGANNVYDLTITATDNATTPNTLTKTVAVTVTNVNEAPLAPASIADQGAVKNQPFSFTPSGFSDPDAGDTLVYSATGLPGWASINATTGAITGTPTTDATAVPVTVTATDGGALAASQSFNLSVAGAPVLSSAASGVTNLDVRSDIVLTATENVSLSASGTYTITITNTGGTGYKGEATVNTQTITITDGVVSGGGAVAITGNKIVINPTNDLDLANNYTVSVTAGAFTGGTSGQASLALSGLSFSTVTPGSGASGITAAAASQTMNADGTLAAGLSWLDVSGQGSALGAAVTYDAGGGNYGFVILDADTAAGSASADGVLISGNLNVLANNWGTGDLFYVDNQTNTAQNNMAASAFGSGNGTTAQPLNWTQSSDGTDGFGQFQIVLDTGLATTNTVLASVVTDIGSTTGMVISA